MFGQDFMELRQKPTSGFHGLKVFETTKLIGSNERMAETQNDYYNHQMDYLTMLSEKFQTDPQVVPQLEDHALMCTTQETLMNRFYQEQENSTKGSEFIVLDEHSEAGGDSRATRSRRCICGSTDELVEDEESSEGFTREVPSVTRKSSKRKRNAETRRNSSTKRRRGKINQKMRALQNLIPNCNKVDKASVLDKAIEYLQTLQLQLQVMSMGIIPYCMPPVISAFTTHDHMNTCTQMPYVSLMAAMAMGPCNIRMNPSNVPFITSSSPLFPHFYEQPLISPTTSTALQFRQVP